MLKENNLEPKISYRGQLNMEVKQKRVFFLFLKISIKHEMINKTYNKDIFRSKKIFSESLFYSTKALFEKILDGFQQEK